MDVLDRIIFLLEQSGHTQKDLTDYLGVKKSAFTDWKAKKSKSYIRHASKIADYFGVSVDYLLTGIEQSKTPTISEDDERFLELFHQLSINKRKKLLEDLEKALNP